MPPSLEPARRLLGLEPPGLSTGFAALDAALGGGVSRGDLLEVVARSGQGGLTLALALAARLRGAAAAAGGGQALLVVDPGGELLLPGRHWPLDALLVRPRGPAEALLVAGRALRCAGVGAVVAPVATLRLADLARLRAAARVGGGVGVLLREERGAAGAPVRLRVARAACPGVRERLRVEVLRARHAAAVAEPLELEL